MAKKRGKKKAPARSSQRPRPAQGGQAKAGQAKAGQAKAGPTKAGPAKAGPAPAGASQTRGAAPAGKPTKAEPAAKPAPTPARKPTKAERMEAVRRQRRRRRLLVRSAVAGVLLLVVGAVAAVVISNRRASERTISQLEAGACQFDRESDEDSGQGRNHVSASVAYRTNPPAGGNHSPSPAAPNVYREPPPDEQVVHSMEHGDIVLWHKPDAAPEVLDQLRGVADRFEGDVLVVPRASMRTPVAATAWHRRLLCPAFERPAFDLFVRSYRDKGPEKVPEG